VGRGRTQHSFYRGLTSRDDRSTSSKPERLVEQLKTFTDVPALSKDQIEEIIVASRGKHYRAFVSGGAGGVAINHAGDKRHVPGLSYR
jgi:hypothetical protein